MSREDGVGGKLSWISISILESMWYFSQSHVVIKSTADYSHKLHSYIDRGFVLEYFRLLLI